VIPLAVDRADVASYVDTLILVYIVLIFIRILMSWIPRIPYNRVLDAVLTFVKDVTDPYLNLFRRFIPMVRLGPGALDISPIVATFVLIIVGDAIIVPLIRG
jgi:YggT family protein